MPTAPLSLDEQTALAGYARSYELGLSRSEWSHLRFYRWLYLQGRLRD